MAPLGKMGESGDVLWIRAKGGHAAAKKELAGLHRNDHSDIHLRTCTCSGMLPA